MSTLTNNQPPELKPTQLPSEQKIFNRIPRQIFIIAVTILATALVVGGGVWWWMSGKINTLQEPQVSGDENINTGQAATSDWKTYRNEEIGIEFKYLGEMGDPSIEIRQPDGRMVESGKSISIYFMDVGVRFVASTKDYQAFLANEFTGSDKAVSHCPNPLSYGEKGNVCKIVKVDNVDAVLENEFGAYECTPRLLQKVYFNNPGKSEYAGLEFFAYPLDLNQEISNLYTCEGDEKDVAAYQEALRQSKNLVDRINLSRRDDNTLEYLGQMMASFEFLN